jgi:hypothetical protein
MKPGIYVKPDPTGGYLVMAVNADGIVCRYHGSLQFAGQARNTAQRIQDSLKALPIIDQINEGAACDRCHQYGASPYRLQSLCPRCRSAVQIALD